MYLRDKDFDNPIQVENLNQITSNNAAVIAFFSRVAQSEVVSYLTQKYITSEEFTDTATFSPLTIYKAKNRVEYLGDLYFVSLPFPEFNYKSFYKKGDQVFWLDKTYTCLQDSQMTTHESAIQYQYLQNLPIINVFPNDIEKGVQYWGVGTSYSIAANTLPSDATKWTKADNRNPQMVMILCDIALFYTLKRISPRNISIERKNSYDSAIQWLNMVKNGEITANLPLKQPNSGARIRFGGNVKLQNSY